jgi:hypothetical protein
MQSGTACSGERVTEPVARALATLWRALCAPIHALLALLEPIVSLILGLLALLGICMSLAFKVLRPGFPFWTMVAVSLSFVVVLMLYHALLRVTAGK